MLASFLLRGSERKCLFTGGCNHRNCHGWQLPTPDRLDVVTAQCYWEYFKYLYFQNGLFVTTRECHGEQREKAQGKKRGRRMQKVLPALPSQSHRLWGNLGGIRFFQSSRRPVFLTSKFICN